MLRNTLIFINLNLIFFINYSLCTINMTSSSSNEKKDDLDHTDLQTRFEHISKTLNKLNDHQDDILNFDGRTSLSNLHINQRPSTDQQKGPLNSLDDGSGQFPLISDDDDYDQNGTFDGSGNGNGPGGDHHQGFLGSELFDPVFETNGHNGHNGHSDGHQNGNHEDLDEKERLDEISRKLGLEKEIALEDVSTLRPTIDTHSAKSESGTSVIASSGIGRTTKLLANVSQNQFITTTSYSNPQTKITLGPTRKATPKTDVAQAKPGYSNPKTTATVRPSGSGSPGSSGSSLSHRCPFRGTTNFVFITLFMLILLRILPDLFYSY